MRTVLPSTLQNMRGAGGGGSGGSGQGQGQGDLSSDEYLDRQEEELNRRVDVHVDQLVHGMQDLVSLAKVSSAPLSSVLVGKGVGVEFCPPAWPRKCAGTASVCHAQRRAPELAFGLLRACPLCSLSHSPCTLSIRRTDSPWMLRPTSVTSSTL